SCEGYMWFLSASSRSCVKKFVPSEVPWNGAKEVCTFYGANLVVILTEEKNQFIADLISEEDRKHGRFYWIGLNQISQETFKWLDGEAEVWL
ncbi:serum lectin isoform 3, partial [Elysia marginata]